MTERERLMQLMIDAKRNDPETKPWSEWLVDYLLEHGVIVPQMNVGDSVYVPLNNDSIITAKVNSMTIHGRSLFVYTAYTAILRLRNRKRKN